jgi:hypothetical protein
MMTLEERLFTNFRTGVKLDYNQWCKENNICNLMKLQTNDNFEINSKIEKGLYDTVNSDNLVPLPAELDDLTRLHFFVRNRKVTTLLEFGGGKSTIVFADALKNNKQDFEDFVSNNLRRSNAFEIHSVDNSEFWLNELKSNFPVNLLEYVNFHFSEVEMTTFNDRICTLFKCLPNISPDFIYLDGPDQFNVIGNVRGISTASYDRLPMAADILILEPFLLPGTLIIADGRTANARFLLNNLQQNWEYCHLEKEDIHAFELIEKPLGKINKKQIDFSYWKIGN